MMLLPGCLGKLMPFGVLEDTIPAIGALSIAANHKSNQSTTLLISQPAVLTVNGPVTFGADSFISGTGTLVANGAITGAGTIIAPAGGVLDFDTVGLLPTTLKLDISGGVTSAVNIKMNGVGQALEIGASSSLTINAAEAIAKGTLRMSGGTVTDALGISVGGRGAGGGIIGFGTIAADLTLQGSKGTVSTVTASGGTLDLTGGFNNGTSVATFLATIDSTSSSRLKFDGNAVVNQPITIGSALPTLEIGTAGALTINGLESITNGTIKIDGGTLTDASGINVGSGAVLTGHGTIAPGTVLSGTGMVKASGGILDLRSDVTSLSTAFDIDAAGGSVLKIDGAVASGSTVTFLGASGALELADVSGGVLQGFNGTIAGLNVSATMRAGHGTTPWQA
jgi:hypothetical protein